MNTNIAALAFLAAGLVSGCADHPLDCALGLSLYPGYCKPGTAGYERQENSPAMNPHDRAMLINGFLGRMQQQQQQNYQQQQQNYQQQMQVYQRPMPMPTNQSISCSSNRIGNSVYTSCN